MTNRLIRDAFWIFFVSVWIVVQSVFMSDTTLDDCLSAYSMDTGISLICFVLFAWWWARNGKPSPIYVAVTFLFGGIVFSRSLELYARYLYAYKVWSDYYQLLESFVWSWRGFPRFLAMSYLASIIFTRLITNQEDE